MTEIRPFSEEHLNSTYQWMQDADLRRLFLFHRTVTPESHREWFERMKTSTTERMYAIMYNYVHVGNMGMKNIEIENGKAETWIYIGDGGMKGKGIASSAYEKLIEALKIEGKIKTVYCHIASFNPASIKLYTRLGFKQVSVFREQREWNNEKFDLLQFNRTV